MKKIGQNFLESPEHSLIHSIPFYLISSYFRKGYNIPAKIPALGDQDNYLMWNPQHWGDELEIPQWEDLLFHLFGEKHLIFSKRNCL